MESSFQAHFDDQTEQDELWGTIGWVFEFKLNKPDLTGWRGRIGVRAAGIVWEAEIHVKKEQSMSFIFIFSSRSNERKWKCKRIIFK